MSHLLNAVILAAGKGTRMRSVLPKVMHCIAGKPMLHYNLSLASELGCQLTAVVIGHGADQIKESVTDNAIIFCVQSEQLGTGHAVAQALPVLDAEAIALVLYGDVPMLKKTTLENLLALLNTNSMGLLTNIAENPHGLGRILRDSNGNITAIVEEKDTTAEQKTISEVNTGIMAIPVKKLQSWLPQLKSNNKQGEYYLTDVIAIAVKEGCEVHTLAVEDANEVAGVNDRVQLAALETYYQKKQAQHFMQQGVTLLSPAQVSFRGDITLDADVTIDMNVILEGKVTCEKNVTIGSHCILKNCHIGEGTVIEAYTHIEEAITGKHCHLGPYARLRPGTELQNEVKLGNFVETKKALIGNGSKVNHLSYVGDCEIGAEVNIGAGTIFCNYDGANKHKTVIGDHVFIGSNSALVAPVNIEDGATIGAGSTITQNVNTTQLAVARSKQRNIDGWQRPKKKN